MEGKVKRVEEKEEEKKGKGKKWFWEKSFLFLFDCVFAFFPFFLPAPTTPPPHNMLTHTHHPPQYYAWVHTITCKQGHVLCCLFFGSGQRDTHCIICTPHSITLHHTTHTNKPNTDTAHGASNKEMTIVNEKGIGQRAKVGQHSSTNTLIEAATTQWL